MNMGRGKEFENWPLAPAVCGPRWSWNDVDTSVGLGWLMTILEHFFPPLPPFFSQLQLWSKNLDYPEV